MTYKKTFFHLNVLFRMFITPIVIGLILYLSIYLYSEYLTKINSHGKELFNEFMILVTVTIYTMRIIFPVIVTIKATFDTQRYLNYIANFYDATLVPLNTRSKYKYVFIAFLCFIALFFLLLFIDDLIRDTSNQFLWVLFLIPLYVLVYQNWIYGLKLAIGDDFKAVYRKNRSLFIKKGILFILLMHIPFVEILQPWFLMSLGDIYYQNSKLPLEDKEQ